MAYSTTNGIENRFDKKTPEELLEITRRGGRASQKKAKARKAMKETLETILAMPLYPGEKHSLKQTGSLANVKGKNITVGQAIMIAQVQSALAGDAKSAQFIRDTMGLNPTDMLRREMFEYQREQDAKAEALNARTTESGVVIIDDIPQEGGGDGKA